MELPWFWNMPLDSWRNEATQRETGVRIGYTNGAMSDKPGDTLTQLIEASQHGDRSAADRLFSLVYDELRDIARRSPHVGRPGETMQATVLANEAYILLASRMPVPPEGQVERRAVFFRAVALAMRTILRDYWRQQRAQKRGGDDRPVPLDSYDPPDRESGELDMIDFLALDEAMNLLETYNGRWFNVVLHRYFAGRTMEETAKLLGIGLSTVKSDWRLARAWLRRAIGADEP